jgi:elongation factor P
VKTGVHTAERFQSTASVEKAWLDKREAEYLYDDPNTGPVFMDQETYEQYSLNAELLGEAMLYVKPNEIVEVTFYEGSPIGLDLPPNVTLQIKETDPAVKGDTVSGVLKPAVVETGATIKVPAHIRVGDFIKVSTITGEFQERVNK